MKKLLLIILGFYVVALTWFTIPIVKEVYLDDNKSEVLDASQSNEQWKFLQDYAKLINYAKEKGYKLTAGELYRTKYQQRYYVARGLSTTFNSKHLKRRAGDLMLFVDGHYCSDVSTLGCLDAYQDLGSYWVSLDTKNAWGGNWNTFKDYPHFERR